MLTFWNKSWIIRVCVRAHASLSFQQLPPGRIWARGSQWDLESRRVTMVTMWQTDGWGQAGRRRPPEDTTVTVGYNRDQRERGERRLPVAPPLNPAGTLHVCWTPRCSAGWWWRTACLSKCGKNTGALDITATFRKSADPNSFLCTVVGFYLFQDSPGLRALWKLGLCSYLCGPNI